MSNVSGRGKILQQLTPYWKHPAWKLPPCFHVVLSVLQLAGISMDYTDTLAFDFTHASIVAISPALQRSKSIR